MVRELQSVLVGKSLSMSLSASQMGQFGVLYIFNRQFTSLYNGKKNREAPHLTQNPLTGPI